jgi:polysaccharide biosynthesis/export protein
MKKNEVRKDEFFRMYKLIFLIVSGTLLSSCITHRNITYIQDENPAVNAFEEAKVGEYTLKPDDELYIQISSLDDAAANIFYNTSQQVFSIGTIQPYGASLLSYSVDKNGYLRLPVIGELYVKDKTIMQVSDMVKDSLTNVLSQPVVSIKLVNRFVSVIGEVKIPGHYVFSQDKITLFDALSMAGDITDYGSRKDVILIRNENGQNSKIKVDLTKSELLASNYYYLRPNDIVYVKPLRKKFWNLKEFPYTIILSTITTALLLYTAIDQ